MELHKLAKDIEGEWHGSAAERLLKIDIKNLLHKSMKPKQLYHTRDEYKQFDLETFRGHLYQEYRSNKESNYWIVKKKKKQHKKEAKRRGLKYVDDGGNDFYDPMLDFNCIDDWFYESN